MASVAFTEPAEYDLMDIEYLIWEITFRSSRQKKTSKSNIDLEAQSQLFIFLFQQYTLPISFIIQNSDYIYYICILMIIVKYIVIIEVRHS